MGLTFFIVINCKIRGKEDFTYILHCEVNRFYMNTL